MAECTDEELDYFEECVARGSTLGDSGKLTEAIACFDIVLARLPRRSKSGKVLYLPGVFVDALMRKSFCLIEQMCNAEAIPLLERARELDPTNPRIYAELGYAQLACEQWESARISYQKAAFYDPLDPHNLRALAHLAILQEDYHEARRLAHKELKLANNSIETLRQLAYAEFMLGNVNTTITCLRRILRIDMDDTAATLQLVKLLRQQDKPKLAVKLVLAYALRHPADDEARTILKELELQLDDPKEMVKIGKALLSINPDDYEALDLLSWGYFRQGKLALAMDIMLRLVEISPDLASNYFKIALLQQAQRNASAAMAALQRCVNLEAPGSELAEVAQEAIKILDQRQLESLFELMGNDDNLRDACYLEPEKTLLLYGYALSPMGWEILHNALHSNDKGMPRRMN